MHYNIGTRTEIRAAPPAPGATFTNNMLPDHMDFCGGGGNNTVNPGHSGIFSSFLSQNNF